MAGLVAARVLADHFDRVTIVEQDSAPTEAAARHGVPQGQHVHVLLNSGRSILTRLFPSLPDDLAAAGAPRADGINDLAWLSPAGWYLRYPSHYVGQSASRPLLEWLVRCRIAENSRITFVDGQSAVGLVTGGAPGRVDGVRIRPRARSNDGGTAIVEETLNADLIVDATGRGSRATQWLRELGYAEPSRTEINAFLGYVSRFYRLPADLSRDWQGLYLQAQVPKIVRGGLIYRLENDCWICTLGGYAKDYPPTDEEGFLEFARSLRSPLLYEAIKDAEPLTAPVANRSSANVWRHYEKLDRWPDGFVAIGDAVCAFNPVYGQGMSVAAKEAVVLGECLAEHRQRPGELSGVARQFQQRIARTIQPVWALATGEDLRVPGAEGGRPGRSAAVLGWYVGRVMQLATEDRLAREIFSEVLNLDQPATRLFHPRLAAKVILGPTGRGGAAGPRAPARVSANLL
jgi:2-polyprenyl-6-methoxyphenol hydroxylase-like FAD-dependent oxidoreductase